MRDQATLDALRAQLKDHEGSGPVEDERYFPYDDATGEQVVPGMTLRGNLTIGYGRNLTAKGLSQFEVEDHLAHDTAEAIELLADGYPWTDDLDDVRWQVLVDMMFNLGPKKFAAFHPTLAHVRAGQWARAAEHIRGSALAHRRKERLARMMETGLW